jgi:heme/copper-type cytochrome/quinol oxidase subunit 2
MRFQVIAVPPGDFAQWIAETRAHSSALDAERYAQLVRPSQKDAPATFGTVSKGLFEAIVASPGAAPTP